jgi:small conductance mechanosensitive channel
VANKTRGWARSVVDVPVSYKEELDRVFTILREVSGELWKDSRWKIELTEEPVVLGVESFGEGTAVIRVVATTRAGRQWDVGRELRRRIKNRFDKERIAIPLPQRTISISDAQALTQSLTPKPPAAP